MNVANVPQQSFGVLFLSGQYIKWQMVCERERERERTERRGREGNASTVNEREKEI